MLSGILCDAASPEEKWSGIPVCEDSEGATYMSAYASGPIYRFLIDDKWEHNSTKPMGIISEEEANRRAQADQKFAKAARTMMPKLIAVAEAAKDVERLISKEVNPALSAAKEVAFYAFFDLIKPALAALEEE